MGKISKTAKASMGGGPAVEKKVVPDAELVRQLRSDRAQHIWPGLQLTDALLREYDRAAAGVETNAKAAHDLDEALRGVRKELYEMTQQFEAATLAVQQLTAELERYRAVAGAVIEPDATEPGLQSVTQGLDSVEQTSLPEGEAQASQYCGW